jgi:hypothetical protein
LERMEKAISDKKAKKLRLNADDYEVKDRKYQ